MPATESTEATEGKQTTRSISAFWLFSVFSVFSVANGFGLQPSPGSAQAYPVKPVRIIVPFTPGTGMDILARSTGQKLSERWAQGVVVDNRPGASGNIGNEFVAKSPPDGYTLMVTANTFA